MGDSGVTAIVVACAFSGKKYQTGLFCAPGRKSFRAAVFVIYLLEKAGGVILASFSVACHGIPLSELCAVPKELY